MAAVFAITTSNCNTAILTRIATVAATAVATAAVIVAVATAAVATAAVATAAAATAAVTAIAFFNGQQELFRYQVVVNPHLLLEK